MSEERLREFERKINLHNFADNRGGKNKYFILKNKEREIYFKNTKEAKEFIKSKFNTPKKKIVYFLIKAGILPIFLKTIELHPIFGDVIFVAHQIKCFDFDKKIVRSFPLYNYEEEFFIRDKKFQMKLPREYSPEIFSVNEYEDGLIYSTEELLRKYEGHDYLKCFKKIYSYYERNGITKNKDGFLIANSHGDFSKGQILARGDDIVFTDWESKKELITKDLYSFFIRAEINGPNPWKNKDFLEILQIYPEEVRKNIKKYIELNARAWGLELKAWKNFNIELEKAGIKNKEKKISLIKRFK